MPFLRFDRYKYATPLAPHVAVCASGRRYVWTGADDGVVSVPYKQDVAELLNPLGDQQSLYEVAWEKYQVAFDEQGKEIAQTVTTPEPEPVAAGRGRPRGH